MLQKVHSLLSESVFFVVETKQAMTEEMIVVRKAIMSANVVFRDAVEFNLRLTAQRFVVAFRTPTGASLHVSA